MKKLASWLFCGARPSEPVTDERLDDCIFAIAQDAFYVYCRKEISAELLRLCAKVPNVVFYCLRKEDEKDGDRAETAKIGEFYRMIHDKRVVGIPLAEPDINSDFYYDRNEKDYVNKVAESWPLVKAYAFEGIGSSFFSISHRLTNVREQLGDLYKQQDAHTLGTLLSGTIPLLEGAWEQCFGIFSRASLGKRLDATETDLAAELCLPYELAFLSFDNTDLATFERSDGLSHPRVLVGKNTNGGKTARPAAAPHIEYCTPSITLDNGKGDPPFHLVCEGVDFYTSARWARTYFLSNLVKRYMKGVEYAHKTDPLKGTRAETVEADVELMLSLYSELITSFSLLLERINKDELKDAAEAKEIAYQSLCNACNELGIDSAATFDKKNIDISLTAYNGLGSLKKTHESFKVDKDWCLYVLRVQATHIRSGDGEDLGGVCYADSFIFLDDQEPTVLTKSIPQVQGWFTSFKHCPLMNYNPEHVYLLNFPQFGKQVAKYEAVSGTIPFAKAFGNQSEFLVRGSVALHEHGLRVKDERFYILNVLYAEVTEVKFIATDIFVLELNCKETEILPLPKHNKGKLILIMPMEFVKDVCYQYFTDLSEKVALPLP